MPAFSQLCWLNAEPAGSSSRQVELPSMRQPANATDTMSNMVLSGQSSASAHTVDRAERPKHAGVHRARPVRINCEQASKAQAAEQRSERMVMSGDLGSQVLPTHTTYHIHLCLFYRTPTRLLLSHTTYTCAFKPGCLMSHKWLHTPDCKL